MIANIRLENPFNFVKENGFRVALKIVAALIGLGLLIWLRQPVAELLAVVSDREAVAAYLAQFGLLAPLLLSLILVLQVIVAAIPGHALMVGGGYVFGFELVGLFDAVGRCLAYAFHIEAISLAQPNHQHPLGRHRPTRIQHADLACLAGQITAGDEFANRPIQRLIDGSGCPAGRRHIIKQVHNDGIGGTGLNFTLAHNNFHLSLLGKWDFLTFYYPFMMYIQHILYP